MGIIYILENKINKKCYIGQTIKKFKDRMLGHKSEAKLNKKRNLIGNALRKYGLENFKITIMDCQEEYLDWLEQEWIKELNSLSPNGYNLDTGGNKNKHLSEETRLKISKAGKGNNNSKGRIVSEEQKEHLRKLNKGKISSFKGKHHTEEAKEKNRQKHIGIFAGENHPMYGKHHTEETKQILRDKRSKQIFTENIRIKMIKSQRLRREKERILKINIDNVKVN